MWDRKDIMIILILSCFTGVDLMRPTWYPDRYLEGFTLIPPERTGLPAEIENKTYLEGDILNLNLTVSKVQEPFKLTLLAVPKDYMKDDTCYETVNMTVKKNENHTLGDIHQYMQTYRIPKGDGPYEMKIPYIFYGCYYVLMTNNERKSWQINLQIFNDTYPYQKRKVEYDSKHKFKPTHGDSNSDMSTEIYIPQECIDLYFLIYEFNNTFYEKNKEIIDQNVGNRKMTAAVECSLSDIIKDKDTYGRNCGKLEERNYNFSITKDENNIVKFVWENSISGRAAHYLRVVPSTFDCSDDLRSWQLFDDTLFKYLEPDSGTTNPTDNGSKTDIILQNVAYIVLVLVSAAILAYFMRRYCRINEELREKKRVEGLQPLTQVIDEVKLKHILLVYAWDSSLKFISEMDNLRQLLKRECKCKVHDVYSDRDKSAVEKLGAHEWVKELLIDGTKVVWVDTPQLRSYFNDKQKQKASTDFRDAAIPYAVELAKSLFQNPTTQYLYHFVVRVKGFEVTDTSDNGPLRVVVPHVRYYIPDNEDTARLCRDITANSTTQDYNQNQMGARNKRCIEI